VLETLFNHGVHYTLQKYPELEQFRVLLLRIHWTEQQLEAAEAKAGRITSELIALERKLTDGISSGTGFQGRSGPSLVRQAFPCPPWISLKWLWPFTAGFTRIRQTCRFITAACSWRWAVAANAVTEIWRKN
jgi:hypothetical protein